MRFSFKLLLAAPVLFFLYFYGLTTVGLLGPDEPRYASVGREMAHSGDWITPRLWGSPWFEKPALLYWMIGAGNRFGLGEELAPRIPIALLSAGFLVFYFLRMQSEFGGRAAWFSSGILATSAGWLAFSHVAVTDLPLAATFSASMLLALPWVRSGGRRGLIIAGVLLGLAVLAKGLVPFVLALPLIWVGRKRWLDLLAFGASAVFVAAPWYLLCYFRNGSAFVDTFIWKHHFGRFLSPDLQHLQPWWFYFPVLLGFLFPWTPILGALVRIDWREPRRLLLVSWVVFGFLFFSVSANKLPGYVLPLLPAVTSLIGIGMAAAPIRLLFPLSAALLGLVPAAARVLPEAVASGVRRAWTGDLEVASAVLCGVLFTAILLLERRSFRAAFGATFATAVLSLTYLIHVSFPKLDLVASARTTWREMMQSGELVCAPDLRRGIRYSLNYYAGREVPSCSTDRDRNHDNLDGNREIFW